MATRPEHGAQRGRLGAGLLLALTAAVFLPGLAADFVYDDQILVVQNRLTGSLARLPEVFRVSLWSTTPLGEAEGGASMYYRPLMLASLALDRALFGLSPAGAHLHSLLWHLLNIALLAALLRRLALPPAAVLAGAALFALHPAQVEGLMFISARNDLMAAAGTLGALLALERGRPGLGGLCLLAAALSKESALLTPLIFAALSLARGRGVGPGRAHAALLLALGVALALRWAAGVGLPARASPERLLDVLLPAAGRYSSVLLWPVDLVPGYHLLYFPDVRWAPLLLLGALCAVAVGLGGARAAAGLLWALVAAGPALPAIAHTAAVPDRYLYLPLAGLALALSAAAARLPARHAAGLGAGLALLLAALSARTIPTWGDDLALWSRTVEVMPSPHAWGGLAKAREAQGDLDGAAEAYARAVVPPRPYEHSCWNLSAIQIRRGDFRAAGEAGRIGLSAGCPPSAELLAPAALGDALSGRWEEASILAGMVPEGADPTGKAVLVRLAIAARRGDLEPLREAAPAPDDYTRLAEMVAAILDQAGEGAAARRVRVAPPSP